VGVVCQIDEGAVVLDEFLYRRSETTGKEARMDSLMTHFWAGLNKIRLTFANSRKAFALDPVEIFLAGGAVQG
jgi:hypothetical protein